MMRLNKSVRTALLSGATMLGTLSLPAIASAGGGGRFHDARAEQRERDRDVRRYDERTYDDRRYGYSRDSHRSKTDVRIDINIGRPRYEPVYEERTTRVWVEPVYRTVCDRVWVAPVYRTECERVWEPDRYAYRDVVYRERGRKVIRQERVLVERGYWRNVERQVLVCEGHWENVERQELVSEGHWEYRTERVQVGEAPVYSNPIAGLFAHITR